MPRFFVSSMAATCMALPVLISGCASHDEPDSQAFAPETAAVGRFDARHAFEIEVPEGTESLRCWLPMPADDDPHQSVTGWQVDAPHPTRIVRDDHGNRFLLLEATDPSAGKMPVRTSFHVERREVKGKIDPLLTRPHTQEELARLATHLEPTRMSVIDDDVRAMARAAVGDEKNPILVARKLYDAVLDRVEYHVKDPKPDAQKTMKATGTGSSRLTYETCTGNCTDFHSLYAALARASRLPTRVVYGSFFKGPLDGMDTDQSYHCWIEFHAPNVGWVPLDVAVADVFVEDFHANEHSRPRAVLTVANGYDGPDAELVDYYFGNVEERRVVWHRGRDLVMRNPRQEGEPLLWNPTGYAEADGKPIKVGRKLTYRSL